MAKIVSTSEKPRGMRDDGATSDPPIDLLDFRGIVTIKPSRLQKMQPSRALSKQRICYWVGRRICLNVSVLTSRNIGVPGGNSAGNRKSESNLKFLSPKS